METVLITGGSGLIGKHLIKALFDNGYAVSLLSTRNITLPCVTCYYWNPGKGEIEPEALFCADYIIHLAGANIGAKRWTKKRRRLIIDSRVQSTQLLAKTLEKSGKRPKAIVSASASGYYGTVTTEQLFTETDLPGNDFTGLVCRQWEDASKHFQEMGIRTVILRTGVVLSAKGGALKKIALPVHFGFASALGTGKQYMPWIHIEDLCSLYIRSLKDSSLQGSYNAVAPACPTNKEFIRTLANVLHRPFVLPPIPAFVFRLLFGRMSDIILKGSRVSAQKLLNSGFHFQFPELKPALQNLWNQHS